MKKHLYIVRHGETDLNKKGICQGQGCDVCLNENGRQQAKELASKLKDVDFGAVYSSPLKRATETAGIIVSGKNLQLKCHDGLKEGDFGVAEGVKMSEIKTWPIYQLWCSHEPKHDTAHYDGGEDKNQIRTRVLKAIEDICTAEKADNILIVSHSAVVRLLNWSVGNYIQGVPNGAVHEFLYEDGKLTATNNKLLLLSCCAPCSCAVIKTMAEKGENFAVIFYNPNIRPYAEYVKRRDENERVCRHYGIDFIELEYDNERWCALTKGLENEPERGARCSVCFYMRLKRVMEYAKENGYTAVGSVLGVSRWKDLAQVNAAAERAAIETKTAYADIEGRKNGMQDLRSQLIKELNLYNQDYCGCKPRKTEEQGD